MVSANQASSNRPPVGTPPPRNPKSTLPGRKVGPSKVLQTSYRGSRGMVGHGHFSNVGVQKCHFRRFRRAFSVNRYEGKCNNKLLTICFYLYLWFDLSVYVQNFESAPQFIIARNIVRYTRAQSLQSIIHTQSFQAIKPFDSDWFNMLT